MRFGCKLFADGRWLAFALVLCQSFTEASFAQNAMTNPMPVVVDDAPQDMSRDQWRERVEEAKRRARENRGS